MEPQYRDDPDLMDVLQQAFIEDLSVLSDIITDGGEGRLALDDGVAKGLCAAQAAGSFDAIHLQMIAAEIQKFGGNSLINVFRGGKGVSYREVVTDVADHFKASYDAGQAVGVIEAAILMKALEQSLTNMSEEDRKRVFEEFDVPYRGFGSAAMAALIAAVRASGMGMFKMAALVGPTAVRFLTGRAVPVVAGASSARVVGVLAGPIGIAVTGLWTAFDLASPAYRVTVPCVLQIAYMRQKMIVRECPSCHSLQSKTARFCSECGQRLEERTDRDANREGTPFPALSQRSGQ